MGGDNSEVTSDSEKWTRKFNSSAKFDFKSWSDNSDKPQVEKPNKTDQIKTETVDATNVQDEGADEKKEMAAENKSLLLKDSSGEKQTPVPISPELKCIIEQNPDMLRNLELTFKEKNILFQDKQLFSDSDSFQHFFIKFADKNLLDTLEHTQKEQSYLQANFNEWKSFIDSLLNESCIVYTNRDFSKTYIFESSPSNAESIKSNISEFLDQNPIYIKVTRHVVEFMKQSEEFSDLEPLKTNKNKNNRFALTKLRFAKLKEEMQKVKCQSFLINESQYELLSAEKKDFLLEVEKKFQVKGNLYEYTRIADLPVLFQVNPLTRISCVVSSDPENIPLDSLISIDWKERTEVDKTLQIIKNQECRIVQYQSWEITMNHHIRILVPEIKTKPYLLNDIKDCLEIVLKHDSVPHTIGISIPAELSVNLVEFSQSLLTIVENLPQNHERPIYILLLVENDKMKLEVIKIMKKITDSKPEISSSVTNDQCVVDVINGKITEVSVDAITCSVNGDLNLSVGGVAKAILQKAGKKIQEDCRREHEFGIMFPELAITKGYNLPCKYIFFGALPLNKDGEPNISTFIESCLEKAVNMGITSIAFPALGTGNLCYKPNEVAAEMESTIKRFMTKIKSNTLKKIVIVIYEKTKNMAPFFELKNKFDKSKDSKGAIFKRREEPLQPNERNRIKYTHDPLQWIQFLNYSAKKETFEAAIKYFVKGLENVTFSVSVDDAQELFFFYDLIILVPDIVQQLDSMDNSLLIPNKSAAQFEQHLTELKTKCHIDKLSITSEMKMSELKNYLVKIRQQYPTIKCEITANSKNVLFRGPNFDLIQGAKYQLECFLGLKQNITVAKDRFNSPSSSEPENIGAASRPIPSAEDTNGFVNTRQRILSIDSENNESSQVSSCFTIKDDFLVKVYKSNILSCNVEGIVNAANANLMHGGGVALAIVNAAGDVINKEGRDKLSGRKLNDGDVLTTSAGKLTQYKYIIHAVGPIYTHSTKDDYCRRKVAETIFNILNEASKLRLSSIALPAISSAIFGVPIDICTDGYFKGVMEFCNKRSQSCTLKEVHFVDMVEFRVNAIKLHFAKQQKMMGNNDTAPLTENLMKNPKEENPTNFTENNLEKCPVCLEENANLNRLKCKHICCHECVGKLPQPICPTCRVPFDIVYGDQPDGNMRVSKSYTSLPGYTNDTYEIVYSLYTRHDQTMRRAYLPICKKGDLILRMLQLAFERRLIFTVGESRTSRQQNVITWNDIHHKTSRWAKGSDSFGYPDPDYFTRVTSELANKGITPDSVSNRKIKRFIEIRNRKVFTTYDL